MRNVPCCPNHLLKGTSESIFLFVVGQTVSFSLFLLLWGFTPNLAATVYLFWYSFSGMSNLATVCSLFSGEEAQREFVKQSIKTHKVWANETELVMFICVLVKLIWLSEVVDANVWLLAAFVVYTFSAFTKRELCRYYIKTNKVEVWRMLQSMEKENAAKPDEKAKS